MRLDVLTLLVVSALNLGMVALALPLVMGRASQAARYAQASVLAQMAAWAALIAAGTFWDRGLSTLAMLCAAGSQWLLFKALAGWLGPRPHGRLLALLVVATPLGYAIGFGHYPFRVAWATFGTAATMLIAARATLAPVHEEAARAWRWLLCACLLAMAVLSAGRGVLGAFFTALYPSFRTPHPVNLAFLVASNVTLVLGTVAILVAWRDEAEAKLRRLVVTDPLTGLLNRRGFDAGATALVARARRHNESLAALVLDLDHFKRVNDQYGHDAGDRALQLFARVLQGNQRAGDLAGRAGGEEFGLLLPHADAAAVAALDTRLRQALVKASAHELGFALDYSAGVALLTPADGDAAALLARADAALYEAKRAGRGALRPATSTPS